MDKFARFRPGSASPPSSPTKSSFPLPFAISPKAAPKDSSSSSSTTSTTTTATSTSSSSSTTESSNAPASASSSSSRLVIASPSKMEPTATFRSLFQRRTRPQDDNPPTSSSDNSDTSAPSNDDTDSSNIDESNESTRTASEPPRNTVARDLFSKFKPTSPQVTIVKTRLTPSLLSKKRPASSISTTSTPTSTRTTTSSTSTSTSVSTPSASSTPLPPSTTTPLSRAPSFTVPDSPTITSNSNRFATPSSPPPSTSTSTSTSAPIDSPSANSGLIKPIDRASIHRICSGQVILDLQTAVKELVENSLDAGATSIEIRVKDFGEHSIEVIDNGTGIEPANYEGLTLKHHTSKLRSFEELQTGYVQSLGFRGEALSSLCALSNLFVVITRSKNDGSAAGVKLTYDREGTLISKSSCARQIGTTVLVEGLFVPLPVRHEEFKRNIKREYTKLVSLVQSYAISSVGVRFNLCNISGKNQRQVVVSTSGKSMIDNIINVFGTKQRQQLTNFQHSCELYKIDGYISKPENGTGRAAGDRQFIFLGGRPVDLPKLARVINAAYRSCQTPHGFPVFFFELSVPKGTCDINVTPDKRTVFLHHESAIMDQLKEALTTFFTPSSQSLESGMNQAVLFAATEEPEESVSSEDSSAPKSLKPSILSVTSRVYSSSSSVGISSGSGRSVFNSDRYRIATSSGPLMPQKRGRPSGSSRGGKASVGSSNNSAISPGSFLFEIEKDSPESDESDGESVKENEIDDANTEDTQIRKRARKDIQATLPFGVTKKNEYIKETYQQIAEEISQASEPLDDDESTQLLDSRDSMSTIDIDEDEPATQLLVVDDSNEIVQKHKMTPKAKKSSPKLANSMKKSPFPFMSTSSTSPSVSPVTLNSRGSIKDVAVEFDLEKLRQQVKARDAERKKLTRKLTDEEKVFFAKLDQTSDKEAEEELSKMFTKQDFARLEVIGQFNLGFVIAKLGSNLFVIDQHASDEKFNFERLKNSLTIKSQQLISPMPLGLPAVEELTIMENLEIFKKNGFEFELSESQGERLKLKSHPTFGGVPLGVGDIQEMICLLQDQPGVMCRPSKITSILASKACRSSIMIGTALSKSQMYQILRNMGTMNNPWCCPHGRPTMRHVIDLRRLPVVGNNSV